MDAIRKVGIYSSRHTHSILEKAFDIHLHSLLLVDVHVVVDVAIDVWGRNGQTKVVSGFFSLTANSVSCWHLIQSLTKTKKKNYRVIHSLTH